MSLTVRGTRIPKRLIATTLLFLLSVVLAVVVSEPARVICIPAMLLSSLGDILLMDFAPVTKRLPFRGFIPGAISFGISHIVYAAAFVTKNLLGGHPVFNPGALIGAGLFVICAASLVVTVRVKGGDRKMMFLEMIYLFFICLNIACASSAAVAFGGITLLSAAGTVVFLASDMFILLCAVQNKSSAKFEVPIWITYVSAQILLLIGA